MINSDLWQVSYVNEEKAPYVDMYMSLPDFNDIFVVFWDIFFGTCTRLRLPMSEGFPPVPLMEDLRGIFVSSLWFWADGETFCALVQVPALQIWSGYYVLTHPKDHYFFPCLGFNIQELFMRVEVLTESGSGAEGGAGTAAVSATTTGSRC